MGGTALLVGLPMLGLFLSLSDVVGSAGSVQEPPMVSLSLRVEPLVTPSANSGRAELAREESVAVRPSGYLVPLSPGTETEDPAHEGH